MTSALLERGSIGASLPATGSWQPGGVPAGSPAAASWCVLPRCEIRFEKCAGGCKIYCSCDDETARATLQNLCRMLSDGMCSCSCACNGITVCQCNFTLGLCKCEFTKDGVCISCTSGDKKCCEMIQQCCDCLQCCCEAGCTCYVCYNNTPVCCGTC